MKPCRLGILVSGSGTNMENIAIKIGEGTIPAQIAVVISNVSGAYALLRAKSHGLESAFIDPRSFQDRDAYDGEVVRVLEENQVDLVVLAGYMLLVGNDFVNRFRHRIMNIHPALLPSFPGTSGVADALEYGAKVTGVTVHFVDEGLDTGPIILQEAIAIREGDTEETLYPRIHEIEYRLYPEAIGYFCRGRLRIEGRRVRISKKQS
jgi:phosphoribosylglycinamide formyltransferase 1